MKTASWFSKLPADHIKIGISRGVPRRLEAGYRVYRKLNPGPWFRSCATHQEYQERYQAEILDPLDPRHVVGEIEALSRGRIPVLVCYEACPMVDHRWCHRALAAEWFYRTIGLHVPEYGFETLPPDAHPMMSEQLVWTPIVPPVEVDLCRYVGKTAIVEGQLHRVIGLDPNDKTKVIVAVDGREFPTSGATLERYFR